MARVGLPAVVVLLVVGLTLPVGASPVVHGKVVSDNPVNWTPHALDGRVASILPVGDKVIVGGSFTKIQQRKDSPTLYRRHLFAFDARTGEIDPTFRPEPDRPVNKLEGAGAGAVFVGGAFTKIAGHSIRGLAKLSTATGLPVAGFSAATDGTVADITVAGDRLYVGGVFHRIRGVPRSALAAVDVATGAVDPGFDLPVQDGRTMSDGRSTTRNVKALDVSPNRERLAVIGNFQAIDGATRHQAAQIDLTQRPAKLAFWGTGRYQPSCGKKFAAYVRDVEYSPNSAFFAIVTTGGAYRSTLCDTAARWDTWKTGLTQQPEWVNVTGGDTLTAVSVTDAAVYVGGHQRWLDNENYPAPDQPGPGSVERPGIGAIHPSTGRALAWNPTRTRGVGVFQLLPTPDGLWVTSDTSRLGREYHGRLGFFPLH